MKLSEVVINPYFDSKEFEKIVEEAYLEEISIADAGRAAQVAGSRGVNAVGNAAKTSAAQVKTGLNMAKQNLVNKAKGVVPAVQNKIQQRARTGEVNRLYKTYLDILKQDSSVPILAAGKIAGFVKANLQKMYNDAHEQTQAGKFGNTNEQIIQGRQNFLRNRKSAIDNAFEDRMEKAREKKLFGDKEVKPKLTPQQQAEQNRQNENLKRLFKNPYKDFDIDKLTEKIINKANEHKNKVKVSRNIINYLKTKLDN